MTSGDGYALDLLSPVRHVATEMERAGSDGPAPTIEAMTATYAHPAGDLARIRQHEGVGSDYQARLWLIRRAVSELGRQVMPDGDGGYRLAKPFDDLKYKGRKVRRVVRAGEESEQEILRDTFHNLDKELRPFRVTVATARSSREADLTLHPLAHAIPRMTEDEFADLAVSMREHGYLKQLGPILTMKGKVIDGRHRLAIASALKIPVLVEEFTGSEEDARDHILSANVVRRHLNVAQRGLIAREFFLPEVEPEAKERQVAALRKGDQPGSPFPPIGGNGKTGKTATEIAAERSSGLATARTMERMAPVDHAPKTKERIRSGEIKSAMQARREALKETGHTDEPGDVPVLKPFSAWKRLGCAAGDVRSALASIEDGDRGNVTEEALLERIDEIRDALLDLRKLVQS